MQPLVSRPGGSGGLLAVLAAAIVLPVLLAAVVFPTPLYDTRELIAWGRHFPLITPVHPPMMVWAGGAVDRLFGPSGAAIVAANQVLMAIGFAYLYAVLRLLVERPMATYLIVLAGTSFYAVFAPLSWALNADILQLTSWPAVIFHLLRARQSDRWLHWILLGVWAAIAALTKYNAAVLFLAIAVGVVALPSFRRCLTRPGFYGAVLIATLLLLPHVITALKFGSTLAYGERHFTGGGSLGDSARRFGLLVVGYLLLLLPGGVIVAVSSARHMISVRVPRFSEASDDLKFIVIVNVSMLVILLGLIGGLGLEYIARYGAPFSLLAVPALAPLLRWNEPRRESCERQTAWTLAGLYGALSAVVMIAYLGPASHSGLQEPTADAARLILDDWRGRYSCGPGYFLGDRQTVYGIGIAAGPDGDSTTIHFIPATRWFDQRKLDDQGAVLVYTLPQVPAQFAAAYPGRAMSEEKRIDVPVLRTHNGKTKEYYYRFVAPKGCDR
ncbi:dolichyl-phosphate-mannose-protein mannosyltransferase [Rhodopseudomonas thermotolerans]|uniref:Dolichyl-phosphate-mannose-protein mannosyltransferase n=2 Tax=Rhodopseudomonas TaxID=1073 RepID=A0A336JMT2_9BRAD|nr:MULTISPECIES: glycosyltransferase family 39 protein [Rhodopseudomonas]RED38108.1 dolichyl-phosphate-mannose-protein mannosyltransferase [Rhodopseudomonas pentothenatexigens]REG05301.1 dolichyl-phosphate-mannose-protein mannosyltransferase [Rhodopseudomonas thermotolerans]SSW90133.1 dolichyl-phosphate-mannose-protein mannosyltransferase [Rhodopseudomonas pentothenatexigens]